MTRSPRYSSLVVAVLSLALGVTGLRAQEGRGSGTATSCCFTNPQYAGTCMVQPAKGETCASIRTYLNDPRSQGRSYCSNTSIRGGWRRVTCAPKNAPPSPSPSPR
jgi:hypothetical protein